VIRSHSERGGVREKRGALKRLLAGRNTSALAVGAIVLVIGAAGGAYAANGSGSITVCIHHNGGGLYQAHKCARHDGKLRWNVQGPTGSQGTQGPQGIQGPQGNAGPPGPVSGIAPSGLTQRGLFNLEASEGAPGSFFGASISFPLELASAPKPVVVPPEGPNPDPAHCPGTVDAPSAAPGYLCLYDAFALNSAGTANANPSVYNIDGQGGASPFGAKIETTAENTGLAYVEGSWAVTAP
jgi:hypothetical protein